MIEIPLEVQDCMDRIAKEHRHIERHYRNLVPDHVLVNARKQLDEYSKHIEAMSVQAALRSVRTYAEELAELQEKHGIAVLAI